MAENPGTVAVYRGLAASRIRSQTAYRTSFVLDLFGSVGFALVELLEVYTIFHNVDLLGGLDLAASLLVFGLARTGFALADTIVGQLDRLGDLIREGRLEILLLRPVSVLGQLVTLDFHLRRIGAALASGVVLAVALVVNDISWTPAHVVLVMVAPLCGAAIFASLWISGGALQLWTVDGSNAVNVFTAGGGYAADYPSSVFPRGLRTVFSFIIPSAFAGYLPTLVLLDLPGPAGLPAWLGWTTPAVAVVILAISLLIWRTGLRHYTGAGG